MKSQARRVRLGGLLAVALGAVALLALPGLAAAKGKDRNHDRIPDRWEKRHKLSLKVKQTRRDQDRDGLRNLAEFRAGTDPRDRDSDDDGVRDGEENAGTIASYDAETGELTIDLFDGGTVTALVDGETRIVCGCSGRQSRHRHRGHGEDHPASASASHRDEGESDGESESDDDLRTGPPGQGDDHNDDPPGHDGTAPGASEGPGRGAENRHDCGVEDLVAGTVVKQAEIETEDGEEAVFEKLKLVKPKPAPEEEPFASCSPERMTP
jgi:hypothetical protein